MYRVTEASEPKFLLLVECSTTQSYSLIRTNFDWDIDCICYNSSIDNDVFPCEWSADELMFDVVEGITKQSRWTDMIVVTGKDSVGQWA